MKIREILTEARVLPDLHGSDKSSILREMAFHVYQNSDPLPGGPELVLSSLLEREGLGSTGVGEGVAIPHAKINGLQTLVAGFARCPTGVAFDAIDHQPVNLIFMLLVPENSAGLHLKALARISRLLRDAAFRGRLLQLNSQEALFSALVQEDAKH